MSSVVSASLELATVRPCWAVIVARTEVLLRIPLDADCVTAQLVGRAVYDVPGAACLPFRMRPASEPNGRKQHTRQADAQLGQRLTARDILGKGFGEFVELPVH